MSDLANTLREKSKRDDALIVGSEIRAALQEQRIEIERLQAELEEHKALVKSYQTDGKAMLGELKADNERLREALEIIRLDTTNPTNQRSRASEIAEEALKQ